MTAVMDLAQTCGFERLTGADGVGIALVSGDASWAELELHLPAGVALHLRLEVPLAAAVGYWHPTAGAERTLAADWAGRTLTSLVSGAPVGCLHDATGTSAFAWGLDELVDELEVRYGVSEEHKIFALELHARATHGDRRLRMVTSADPVPLAVAVSRVAGWLSDRLVGTPLPVPEVARRPVYSTWYTFTQDLDQERVTAEAALAAGLGCGSVFVDDGWQRLAFGRGYSGCGDWVPDRAKFPDLARSRAISMIRTWGWCCGSPHCCWGPRPMRSPS